MPLLAQTAPANFTTVINIPGDPLPNSIPSNSQLNLREGGLIPSSSDQRFIVGSYFDPTSNIEVNIYGGEVGISTGYRDSTVNISGGVVGTGMRAYFSELNITGGQLLGNTRAYDSQVNVLGGDIDSISSVMNNVMTIGGGEVDDLRIGSYGLNEIGSAMITGGDVGRAVVQQGELTISDGRLGYLSLREDTLVTVTGGNVEDAISFDDGTLLVWSGGTVGRLSPEVVKIGPETQGRLAISGNEFLFNGESVSGLTSVGDSSGVLFN